MGKNNGFEINITETTFKSKTPAEQNWILFQGIVAANRSIVKIEEEGCEFALDKYKQHFRWTISAVVGSAVFALGVVYILYQLACK